MKAILFNLTDLDGSKLSDLTDLYDTVEVVEGASPSMLTQYNKGEVRFFVPEGDVEDVEKVLSGAEVTGLRPLEVEGEAEVTADDFEDWLLGLEPWEGDQEGEENAADDNPLAELFASGQLTEEDLLNAEEAEEATEEEAEAEENPEAPAQEKPAQKTGPSLKKLVRDARRDASIYTPEGREIVGLHRKVAITGDIIRDEMRRKNPSGRIPYTPHEKLGYLLTVTSGFGGGGKTTFAYYAGQVMTMAFRYARKNTRVVLIEGDYGNPKLQNRLNIPVGQDLSRLAAFLDDMQKRGISEDDARRQAHQIMEDMMFEDPDSGMYIIACPYDKSLANPPALREALKKAVMWAQRSMGYFVILDADTIGLAEGVELDLVEMSNSVVVIANTREPNVERKGFLWWKPKLEDINPNERSHIDDALVMIQSFTKSTKNHGFGIPGERIRVFFNETSSEELTNKVLKKDIFPKNMVVGSLPKIPEIERSWAGDLSRNRNRSIKVAQLMAEALLRITQYRELDQLLKAMR